MDRRTLLQGLLAVPVVSAFERNTPQVDSASKDYSSKLRVVLGGAFTIVLQTDRGWGVRAFTPTDPQRLHKLYVVGDKVDRKDPQENLSHNFTLPSNGLKNTAGRRPEIDPALCDFTFTTDRWCQERYWVTIDLPAPQRIGFMGPLTPVVFGDPQMEGCMPPNHVLEYDVIHPRLVRVEEQGQQALRPAACEQLKQRYEKGCADLEKQNSDRPKGREHENSDRTKGREDKNPNRTKEREDEDEGSAQGMCKGKEAYDSFCRHGDLTFFFGVGPENPSAYPDHAIQFFNERILQSFPGFEKKLRIRSLGHPGAPCKHACSGSHAPGQTFLRDVMPQGHLLEAGDVLDCHAIGPIAIFP